MDKLIILMLALTAPCHEAKVAEFNKCMEDAKGNTIAQMNCSGYPQRTVGSGIFLGVPLIEVDDESCYEVRVKYIGENKVVSASLKEWNEVATPVFFSYTEKGLARPLVNKKKRVEKKSEDGE